MRKSAAGEEVEEEGGSLAQKQKISFLENNLDQLTKVRIARMLFTNGLMPKLYESICHPWNTILDFTNCIFRCISNSFVTMLIFAVSCQS